VAVSLTLQYIPTQRDDSDLVGYPYSAFQDITSPNDDTGSPMISNIMNDVFGTRYALLDEAGIVPSNIPDKVGSSEVLQASKVVNGLSVQTAADLLLQDPTLLPIGMGASVYNDSSRTGEWKIAAWTVEIDNDDTVKVNGTWSGSGKYWQRIIPVGAEPGLITAEAPFRVGSESPSTDRHIAVGSTRILSKYDSTTPAPLLLGSGSEASLYLSTNTSLTVDGEQVFNVIGGRVNTKPYYDFNGTGPTGTVTIIDMYSTYVEDIGGSRPLASTDEGKLTKLRSGSPIDITVNKGAIARFLNPEMQFWYPADQLHTVNFIEGTDVKIHRNAPLNPGDFVCLKRLLDDGAVEEYILCGVATP